MASERSATIANFGRDVCFQCGSYYEPRDEGEVLSILAQHANGRVRVVASRHSWNPGLVSEDAVVNLRHLDRVEIETDTGGDVSVNVQAGCTIQRLLRELHFRTSFTMPTLGAVTVQQIGGAISTGTHGSGKHSLSHYLEEVRVAAFDPDTGEPRIFCYRSGAELRAARCALGALGIVLSVRFRCIPKYLVAETVRRFDTLDDVLSHESENPLQQFLLMPYAWAFYVYQRRTAASQKRSRIAPLYRAYLLLMIDVGFHLLVRFLTAWRAPVGLMSFFYRRLVPPVIWTGRTVVDDSHRLLTLRHELFRHREMEVFIPLRHLAEAIEFIREAVRVFSGTAETLAEEMATKLRVTGLLDELHGCRGAFVYHYPILFRRVLPDDTLISMAAGQTEVYSCSFFTYRRRDEGFDRCTRVLAQALSRLFDGRLHWGKHFPLEHGDVARLYPELPTFRELCGRTDPRGVFRNEFLNGVLGFWIPE